MSFRVGEKRQSKWYDLREGVRVLLRPFDAALDLQAVAEARPGDMAPIDDDPESETLRHAANVSFTLRYTIALAKHFVEDWEGVLDVNDEPAPLNETNLSEVIMLWPGQARALRDVFDEHFLSSEKKGLRPGPNGGGAAATPTAGTAPSSVSRARKNGQAPTAGSAPS